MQGSLSVVVVKEATLAYELLALVVAPQAMLKTQQTPKEEAQDPEAVPPRLVHSEAV